MTWPWFAAAYAAVLTAELVADKTLISAGALATRYGASALYGGLVLAFAVKSGAAVALGGSLARLPAELVTAVSVAAFLASALVLWRKTGAGEEPRRPHAAAARAAVRSWPAGLALGFSAVFFTEWADPGQLATAALAARSHAPLAVWLAALLALSTKGLLAVTLGARLGRHVPERTLRLAGATLCLAMGIATAFHVTD